MKTIIVLMDTLRRDHLKCYNPQTDCIADNITGFSKESCTFDNHFTGSLPCIPARRDLFTGRLNFLERSWGPIEIFDETLPKILNENGVRSHMITDHAHYFRIGGENYCQQFNTYEFFRGQESDPWISLMDDPYMPETYFGDVKRQYQCNRTKFVKEEDYPSVQCFDAAIDWVEKNRHAEDFLLMVETFDPHEPFDIPEKYLDMYNDTYDGPHFNLPKYHKIDEETDEAMAHLRNRYKALLTMTDVHFGKFIDKLKEVNMYEDTMIILTTDHGYCLGEREYIGKSYMPCYNEICNIPLLIHYPQASFAGERRCAITQNIDIMPTILDYQNIPCPERVTGKSVKGIVENHEKGREYALYGTFGLSVNLFDGKYTYFRGPRDNTQCYEYTTSLTTIRDWLGKAIPEKIECGYFLPQVPFPVYKIPEVKNALVSDAVYHKEDHLFDIEEDYGQTREVADPEIRNMMEKKLSDALADNYAPEEQWARLGLKKGSDSGYNSVSEYDYTV